MGSLVNRAIQQGLVNPQAQPTQQGGGFKGFVQTIASPFIKTIASVPAALEGAGKLIAGDVQGASNALTRERSFGYLGSTRPVGINQETGQALSGGQWAKDFIGTGAELGAYAVGGEGAVGVGKATMGGLIKQGAKTGFKTGLLSGAFGQGGAELQKPDSTFGSVVGETFKGGTVGALSGGVLGAAAPIAGKAVGALRSVPATVGKAVQTTKAIGSQVGRGVKQYAKQAANLADEATRRQALKPTIRKSVEAGIPENFAMKIKTYTKGTSRRASQILDAAADKSPRPKVAPKEVAGKAIMERATSLANSLKSTGKKLGVAKMNLKGKSVDTSDLVQGFTKDLEEMGIYRVKNGRLIPSNPIPKDDLDAMQSIYNYLIPKKGNIVSMDAGYLDDLRRFLFDEFSIGKLQQKPLSSRSTSLIQRYRSSILGKLSALDKNYGKLSKAYAEQHGALEEFVKLLGYKGRLEDLGTKNLRAGEVALRMLGNAADRPTSVINQLNEVAKKYGYKELDNIDDLIDFADAMEDLYGTTQSRSFKGEIERAGSAILDPRTGVLGTAERLFDKGGMAGTLAEKEAALRELLKSAMMRLK